MRADLNRENHHHCFTTANPLLLHLLTLTQAHSKITNDGFANKFNVFACFLTILKERLATDLNDLEAQCSIDIIASIINADDDCDCEKEDRNRHINYNSLPSLRCHRLKSQLIDTNLVGGIN